MSLERRDAEFAESSRVMSDGSCLGMGLDSFLTASSMLSPTDSHVLEPYHHDEHVNHHAINRFCDIVHNLSFCQQAIKLERNDDDMSEGMSECHDEHLPWVESVDKVPDMKPAQSDKVTVCGITLTAKLSQCINLSLFALHAPMYMGVVQDPHHVSQVSYNDGSASQGCMDGSVNICTRVCGSLVHGSIYQNGTIKINSLTSIRQNQEVIAVRKICQGVREAALDATACMSGQVVANPSKLHVGAVRRGGLKLGSSCMFLIRCSVVHNMLQKRQHHSPVIIKGSLKRKVCKDKGAHLKCRSISFKQYTHDGKVVTFHCHARGSIQATGSSNAKLSHIGTSLIEFVRWLRSVRVLVEPTNEQECDVEMRGRKAAYKKRVFVHPNLLPAKFRTSGLHDSHGFSQFHAFV